ncbi:MAG: GTP-binding protein HSR1 [Wenzhouxiangella sp.]|nr:MAG: GTP-binding protein HSR1 [Wenzhouxiangella sp.]
MKPIFMRFGRLRIAAVVVSVLPLSVLPVLGVIWLWQSSQILAWLGITALAALIGLGLNQIAVRREQRALPESDTGPAPHWPPVADECWKQIEQLADEATIKEWPLNDAAGLMRLARQVLEQVAGHFHPGTGKPLLEMTLPHTLAVIERAARELRDDITSNIPFSHQLRLGTVARASSWRDWFKRHEGWYRAGRFVFAPQSAVVAELRRAVGNQAFQHGSAQIQNWLLREYIRKLGYHAIELYGGYARVEEGRDLELSSDRSTADQAQAGSEAQANEPLRILLLGRTNAGKSSLINALFGELTAATDLLPDTTTQVIPYRLDRDDQLQALVFDTPGFDGELFADRALAHTARSADLILWVSAANRADRAQERARLDQIRGLFDDPAVSAPPVLVVMSHIDRLRPLREWNPPYPLNPPTGTKAKNIVDALTAVSSDLGVPVDRVIPVCLAEQRRYNIDDALWAAMLFDQPAANRVRLLRCVQARRQEENWALLRRQLVNAGRILVQTGAKARLN